VHGRDRASWEELAAVKLDPARPTGLLLAGMGGPDGAAAVEPFLRNLFADPAMIPLPSCLARPLGAFVSRRRSATVRERYREMGLGGASPQLEWTLRQGRALEERLRVRGLELSCAPAMRYWHPYAAESVHELLEEGVEQFLILPTYPQYAMPTTGSSLLDACAALTAAAPEAPISLLPDWHLLPGYLDALAEHAAAQLVDWAEEDLDPARCALLYTAHSLPERVLRQGDPYERQVRATVRAAHARLHERMSQYGDWLDALPGGDPGRLVFQSKVGPMRWLGPELGNSARELVAQGCRHLLVQPVSFCCEHIETLHELDIELAIDLKTRGLEEFRRGSALNLNAAWLDSLANRLFEGCFDHASHLEVADVI
jgi:protoporphyrin/coproporphyrin ferrochelatase